MRAIELDHTPSTEHQAATLSRAGAPVPFCVRADQQDTTSLPGGKGRTAPEGGLWCTVVWPTQAEGRHYAGAPLLASAVLIAVAEAMLPGDGPSTMLALEWPGRVTGEGRCVARVKSRRLVLPDRPKGEQNLLLLTIDALIGLDNDGVGAFQGRSTSLRTLGWSGIDVPPLAERFRDDMAEALGALETDGLNPKLRRLIDHRLVGVSNPVRFTPTKEGAAPIEGTLIGVDHRAALVLETETGKVACRVGELEVV
ncbi:MAG: hypothetical protein AAGI30_04990 [Planctomycetota bacterium]